MQTSYGSLAEHLAGGRNKLDRPVEPRNTRAIRLDEHTIAVRYHQTDIVTYHDDGRVVLDCHGWRTQSTKTRLDEVTPPGIRVHQMDRRWWVVLSLNGRVWDGTATRIQYADGITFREVDGLWQLDTADEQRLAGELLAEDITERLIKDYVQLYTDEEIKRLMADGGGGDCFYCQGQVSGITGAGDHLVDHVLEQYTMVNLLANAMRWQGYGHGGMLIIMPETGRKALRKYLTEAFSHLDKPVRTNTYAVA